MSMTETTAQQTYSYLALGDSYTIGEGLPHEDNFPHQTVDLLRKKGMAIADPEIVAKTGWTTDELMDAISKRTLKSNYDLNFKTNNHATTKLRLWPSSPRN
jgi:hypothetical protein